MRPRPRSTRFRATATIDGRRIQFYAPSQREANAKRDRVLSDWESQRLKPINERITLGAWLDEWVLTILPTEGLRPKTLDYYASCAAKVRADIGHHRLGQLTARDARQFLERSDGIIGSSELNGCRVTLHKALKAAVRDEVIHRNVMDGLSWKSRCVKERVANAYTKEETLAILHAAEGTRVHALLYTAVQTGMRQGELLGLRWSNVDFDRGLISVVEQAQDGKAVPVKTESGKRIIGMSDGLKAVLKGQLEATYIESKQVRGYAHNDLVFPTSVGTPQNPSNLRREYDAVVRASGVRRLPFHCLRHTNATLSLGAGVDLHVVSKLLGHSSISITANIYTHQTTKSAADAAARLAEAVGL